MSKNRIANARLRGQFLTGSSPHTSAIDVVRALGAVQSQDYLGAKWAIAQRTGGLTNAELDAAFDSGEIIRTHVMRPTWHFVAPEDLRWMLALTAPRIGAAMASYNRKLELDEKVFRKTRKVIVRALEKQTYLTRTQIKAELQRGGLESGTTQRLGHIMMQAEIDGVICSGPRVGKQFTYALVDARIAHSRKLHGDEALGELARKYFASRAPATVADFSWWSGLTMPQSRRAIDVARNELILIEVDGLRYVVPQDFEWPGRIGKSAHLLPNYDEYFIGFRDRSAIGVRLSGIDLVTGGNALIAHVVFVDGQLVGGWKQRQVKSGFAVDFKILNRLAPAEQKRVDAELKKFENFLGVTQNVS